MQNGGPDLEIDENHFDSGNDIYHTVKKTFWLPQ